MDKKDYKTHNSVRMLNISTKPTVYRKTEAEGMIHLTRQTIDALRRRRIKKGDVLATAEVAGILAAKKTHELIPLCHPVPVTGVDFKFNLKDDRIEVSCTVDTDYKTGVEMEALVGVSTALLTVWDMVKYMEKDEKGQYPATMIDKIRVVRKVKGSEFPRTPQ